VIPSSLVSSFMLVNSSFDIVGSKDFFDFFFGADRGEEDGAHVFSALTVTGTAVTRRGSFLEVSCVA